MSNSAPDFLLLFIHHLPPLMKWMSEIIFWVKSAKPQTERLPGFPGNFQDLLPLSYWACIHGMKAQGALAYDRDVMVFEYISFLI